MAVFSKKQHARQCKNILIGKTLDPTVRERYKSNEQLLEIALKHSHHTTNRVKLLFHYIVSHHLF